MGQYIIEGGKRLSGSVKVHGAKNSALPILAATVAVGAPCVIHNCPNLSDIEATIKILRYLGCKVDRDGDSITVDPSQITANCIEDSLMQGLRSSIIFLGALIAATGEAVMSRPGGCNIGLRPIDLHLISMEKLGVVVTEDNGQICCSCTRVKGNTVSLSFPSVGATENIILAAVKASGTTTVINAAREPEIVDLADFLNACGAKISGAGEATITIEGVDTLNSVEYSVMPDRIVASTYMAAAAVTGSTLIVNDVEPLHLVPVFDSFRKTGCIIESSGRQTRIIAPERLKTPGDIITEPYPGFPTDCQAIMSTVATVSDGITLVEENIFENRFRHFNELKSMGANISIEVTDKRANVIGVPKLYGSLVHATDLRAGAALVVAGLCAEGTTTINSIHYIDRGYESLEENLTLLGANIKRKE